ncbi:exosome complex exonuclease RRP44 [Turdus rufiventris]|nr:exosome complex exonuclease RRP44 [Turdus rufiventris]
MLTSRTFVKRTRAGAVVKVVREHYLRDDIACGAAACRLCTPAPAGSGSAPGLEARPSGPASSLCPGPHFLLPDTNLLLHQIDILEDPVIKNVIVLQTVLQEVRHRSAPVYKRIRDVIQNPEKHFYSFTNEHHRETYIEQKRGETANDRNDRAIRVAVKWYNEHLKKTEDEEKIQVIFLTNDNTNKEKALEEGITAYTCEEYIKSLTANPELVDRLACVSDEGKEIEGGKIIFPEHIPLSKLQQGIKSGVYLQGTYRANRENYLEATVWVHGDAEENKEIIVQGLKHLNRAIHEDVVAVELLAKDEWVAPSSVVLQDDGQNEEDIENEEEKENILKTSVSKDMLRPTGRVVGIIKRNWRPYCGMLSKSQIKEARRHLFTPADRRIPRIRIETRQADTLEGQRIIVAIDGWPRNSRYPNDMKHREDLRHLSVCSVDPPGCTDIDDALHYREIGNGNLEVGVHIADVSHFIRPGNALDEESVKRGTTVYLCEKRIDMVPELLSSNLCSLRSNVDRLAFSCIWEMNHKAEILKTRFTKSIINSKASLTYAEAQMRIDSASMNDDITLSLRGLNKLAKILKKKRIENGALTLASPEVRFHMDSETHDPIDLQTKELKYADIIVHRLLAVAIGADSTYPELTDKHKLAEMCKNLNYRHKMAQYAQRASVAFHTQLFFKTKGVVNEDAYILFVRKNAIVVLIPKYGLEGTVFFEEKDKPTPKLEYNSEVPSLTVEDTTFHVFDKVKVNIMLDDSNIQHQKMRMVLVEPKAPLSGPRRLLKGLPRILSRLNNRNSISLFSQDSCFMQPSDHICGPVDSLQQIHVAPVLGAPDLDAALQISGNDMPASLAAEASSKDEPEKKKKKLQK